MYDDKKSRAGLTDADVPGPGTGPLAPGKQTLVQQLALPVQRRGEGGEAAVHAAAARGVATPSTALPHADAIQRSFGRHDVSSVKAHTGSEAAASARDMGADAYATGDHVVLGKGNDLETVAHEAAHVVQQRGGVQLKGGVGAEGDAYERNADEVAAAVVQGKSAEGLLDPFAGGGSGGAAGVQRRLSVAGAEQAEVEAVWARIKDDPRFEGIEREARALLAQWIESDPRYANVPANFDKVSSDRAYRSDEELIRALSGDLKASGNLAKEGELAKQTIDEGHVNNLLGAVVEKINAFESENAGKLPSTAEKPGRYGGWTYPKAKMAAAVQNDPGDLQGRIAMIADYALTVRKDKPAKKNWQFLLEAEQDAARDTHWNTNESSPWVEEAREKQMPLSAGPSATTAQVLALAVLIKCTEDEKAALAWGLFALWNGMPLHVAGTHRFHEVMDVAALHGVQYEKFTYSDPPKPKSNEKEGST